MNHRPGFVRCGWRGLVVFCLCLTALRVGGCVVVVPGSGQSLVDGNRDAPSGSTVARTAGEPNDDFDNALVAVFDESNRARLQGVITPFGDVDVFNLGPLRAGDRIIIDVSTEQFGTKLDSSVGLFDAEQNLFIETDNTEVSFDPSIDQIVRHDSDTYYLVVIGTVVSAGDGVFPGHIGAYLVDIEVIPGNAVPAPRGQTVFLDFDGGPVGPLADTVETESVPPLDAGDVHPDYAGQTEALKASIVDGLTTAFADFDVTFVTSDDADTPREPFSTVLFSGPVSALPTGGRAEQTDPFNADPTDIAVVTLGISLPRSPLPVDRIGTAFANIAAHEIGHLLGLRHAHDRNSLMGLFGTRFDARPFDRAPVFSDVFPIGFQDARLLLSETVGAR